MKKNRLDRKILLDVFFVIIVSIFCCAFIFNESIVEGNDIKYHLYRIIGLSDAFSEGQILPKIYPLANYGFGYASPLFYCDLFLYPFALLYKYGVSLVVSYKLMLLCVTITTTIIVLVVTKKIFHKTITPYVLTMLYLFCNYRFVNVVSRAAIGEVFAMAFIPLVLYAIYKLLVLREKCGILLGTSFSLLILSHVLSTVIVSVLFFVLLITFCIKERNKESILQMLKSLSVGIAVALLLTAWYLLPMIEQMLDQEFWYSYNLYYPAQSALNLDVVFHVFADMKGAQTLETVSLGLALYLPLVLYFVVKKNKLISYLFILSIIIFLFASGWLVFESELKLIQFSWRLYVILLPLIVYIIGYILDNLNKRATAVVSAILLLYTITNGTIVMINGMNYVDPMYNNYATKKDIFHDETYKDDERNIYYNDDELSDGQYRPYEYVNYLKSATKYICYYDENIQPIELIYDYQRNYTHFEFTYNFDKDYVLEMPILWYKGYKAYEIINDNGSYSYIPINCYMNPNNKKVLIDVQKGEHSYYVEYQGTRLQKITLYVSTASLFAIIIIEIRKKLVKY